MGRLPREQHPDRIAKASAYFAEQLSAFQSALAALLDVEVDNQENDAQLKEAAETLTGRLRLKLACIRAVRDEGFSVAVVQKAKTDAELGVKKNRKTKAKEVISKAEGAEADDRDALVKMLREWRKEKASVQGVPIFTVRQQKTLMAIVEAMPRSEEELKAIPGIGKGKMELYGKEILGVVADFREAYGLY